MSVGQMVFGQKKLNPLKAHQKAVKAKARLFIVTLPTAVQSYKTLFSPIHAFEK
jgi:hypothetical protein